MKIKKNALLTVALVGVSLTAFLILDRIPEVDPDPANAPIEHMAMVGAMQRPLTEAVINPAGIVFLPDSKTYLVSTDDQNFIELSEDFSFVISSTSIPNRPHAIGDTEGVTYLRNDRAAVVGENGVVILMTRNKEGWEEQERFPIPGFIAEPNWVRLLMTLTRKFYIPRKRRAKRYSIR